MTSPTVTIEGRRMKPVGGLQTVTVRIDAASHIGAKKFQAVQDQIVLYITAHTNHPDGLDGLTLHWTGDDGKVHDFLAPESDAEIEYPPASTLFTRALDGQSRRRWNLVFPDGGVRRFKVRSLTDTAGKFTGPASYSVWLVMEARELVASN